MNESKAARYQRYRRRAESAGVVSGAAMLALVALTPLSRWLAAGALGFGAGLPELPGAALGLVIFAEVFCAFGIIVGLFTRLAAIPLLVTMLVAVFHVHAADPFGKKELAALYAASCVTLVLAGAGQLSIDGLLARRFGRGRG